MEILAQRLKTLMEEYGVNEKKLSDEADVHRHLIRGLLDNAYTPSMRVVMKLALYFSCTTDYLLGLSKIEDEYGVAAKRKSKKQKQKSVN